MVKQVAKVNDIQGTLHVDSYLTTYGEAFWQDQSQFISTVASSTLPVSNESDKYPIYPRGYFWRDEAQVRPLGGRPVQVGYKIDQGTYLAEEWALEHTIDDRQRSNTDAPINLERTGIRLLEQKQLIRSDRIWVSKFFKAGVWTNDVTGGTDFTPFNDAASTPLEVIDEHKDNFAQNTGYMPNTLILGVNVKRALRSNPDIADRIKYTQTGVADNGVLGSLFEIPNIRVARSVYNAAAEGADDDFNFIADPNGMWMGYIEPSPSSDAPTAIMRFGWTGLIPGAGNSYGGVINRGRDDRAYSDWFHSRNAFDMRATCTDLGMFFSNAFVPVS